MPQDRGLVQLTTSKDSLDAYIMSRGQAYKFPTKDTFQQKTKDLKLCC
jgi:hypothetical protein